MPLTSHQYYHRPYRLTTLVAGPRGKKELVRRLLRRATRWGVQRFDRSPARDGAPAETLFIRFTNTSRTYGPTSFAEWRSDWEHLQIDTWISRISSRAWPIIMLTAVGNFLDSSLTVPGVRVGSDVRCYQSLLPIVHRLAVLSFVGMGDGWFYALVFVYGDENGDTPETTEKVGILRVPHHLVGPSVIAPDYDDELELVSRRTGWYRFDEDRNVNIIIAFPSSHPRPASDVELYHAPTPAEPSHTLRIEEGELLARRFRTAF